MFKSSCVPYIIFGGVVGCLVGRYVGKGTSGIIGGLVLGAVIGGSVYFSGYKYPSDVSSSAGMNKLAYIKPTK